MEANSKIRGGKAQKKNYKNTRTRGGRRTFIPRRANAKVNFTRGNNGKQKIRGGPRQIGGHELTLKITDQEERIGVW